MAFLRSAKGNKFEAVNGNGKVLATGTLQVDLKQGAQRHGGVTFISDEHTEEAPRLSDLDYGALAAAQAGM